MAPIYESAFLGLLQLQESDGKGRNLPRTTTAIGIVVIPNDHGSKLLEPQIWLTNTQYSTVPITLRTFEPQQNEANAL